MKNLFFIILGGLIASLSAWIAITVSVYTEPLDAASSGRISVDNRREISSLTANQNTISQSARDYQYIDSEQLNKLVSRQEQLLNALVEIRNEISLLSAAIDTKPEVSVADISPQSAAREASKDLYMETKRRYQKEVAAPEQAFSELSSLIDGGIASQGEINADTNRIRKLLITLDPEQRMNLRVKITQAINEGRLPSEFYYNFF